MSALRVLTAEQSELSIHCWYNQCVPADIQSANTTSSTTSPITWVHLQHLRSLVELD